MKWRRRVFKMGRHKFEQKDGKWQPVLREEHVVKEIVERLWFQARIKMWRVRERIPGRGAPSTPGIPDLIGWAPPHQEKITNGIKTIRPVLPLFIEVKRPGGARRPAQESFIEEARSCGCAAFFAESWADVVRELGNFGIQLKEAT